MDIHLSVYLNSSQNCRDTSAGGPIEVRDFEFVQDVGVYFQNFVKNTLLTLKDEEWSDDDKQKQLTKRSRYAEFNLLYDRGTKFGLETGGNIDAILMSMPPLAKWD